MNESESFVSWAYAVLDGANMMATSANTMRIPGRRPLLITGINPDIDNPVAALSDTGKQ
jgi:hypothetical protein